MRVLTTGLPGNSHLCPCFCLNKCLSCTVLLHFCLTAALFQYTIIYFFLYFFIFKQLLFALLFLFAVIHSISLKICFLWVLEVIYIKRYSLNCGIMVFGVMQKSLSTILPIFEFQKRLYQLIMLTVLVKYAIIIIWRKQLALRIYSKHVSYI